MRTDIERFPAEKRQIRFEEPPEMIFFDVDEEAEEAEFIRVDDLFRLDAEDAQSLTGLTAYTFFPRKRGVFISGSFARLLRRTLVLLTSRFGTPTAKIRIRPRFVQWQIDLSEEDDPETLAREFRTELETQARNLLALEENDRFWSNSCLVSRGGEEPGDDLINRLAALVQEE